MSSLLVRIRFANGTVAVHRFASGTEQENRATLERVRSEMQPADRILGVEVS